MALSDVLLDFRSSIGGSNGHHALGGVKLYEGTVISNDDPLKRERIKVRPLADDLWPGTEDDSLPWIGKVNLSAQGNGNGVGSIGVPIVGSKVIFLFGNAGPYHAYYLGSATTTDTALSDLLVNYPHAYGLIDANNNIFLVDTVAKTIFISHFTGTSLTISANGAVDVMSAMSTKVQAQTNMEFVAGGNISFDCANFVVRSGTTDINSSSPSSPSAPVTRS